MSKNISFTDVNGVLFPDWEITTLGEVATNKSQKYDPTKSQEEFRCVELEHLDGGGSGVINGWVNSLGQKSGKNAFKSGDVLLSKLRPYLKKWARPDFDGVCSSEIWSISPVSPKVTTAYLYVFMQSPSFQKPLIDITSGTKMPRADWSIVAASEFPIPSLPEQEKIAGFFSALDERIALTAAKVELLKEQKQGYLQRVFSGEIGFTDDNGDTYPEWEEKKLGDVSDFINGFAFKPDHLGSEGTTVVKIKELLDPSDLSVKTTIDVPKSLHLNNGDIIFSWSMTLACRIWNSGPAYLNQHLYKVVVKEGCDPCFINYLLDNEIPALRNLMHGGTAKHITRKDLLPYKVMIPSIPEQKKIAKFFSALDEQLELTENKLTLLKEQKEGYLQGIFDSHRPASAAKTVASS